MEIQICAATLLPRNLQELQDQNAWNQIYQTTDKNFVQFVLGRVLVVLKAKSVLMSL